MFDPIQHIRRRARRLVVTPPDETGVRLVYAVTHMHVPELAVMPVLDVGRATAELELAVEAVHRLEACKTKAERARVEAELEERKTRAAAALREDLVGTPERAISYLERSRAIVMGAVEAVGLALESASLGAAPPGTLPEEVCQPLHILYEDTDREERIYLRPVTLVAERIPGPNQLSILDYRDGEVCRLAKLFANAFTVQTTVQVLPRKPGDPAVGGSTGDAVRGPAVDVPADRGSVAGGGHRRSSGGSRKGAG